MLSASSSSDSGLGRAGTEVGLAGTEGGVGLAGTEGGVGLAGTEGGVGLAGLGETQAGGEEGLAGGEPSQYSITLRLGSPGDPMS
jgi:hypothetical protein